MNYFEISGHHERWNLNSIFSSKDDLQRWDQIVYELSEVGNKKIIEVILQKEAKKKIDIKCAISSKRNH